MSEIDYAMGNLFYIDNVLYFSYFTESDSEMDLLRLKDIEFYCIERHISYIWCDSKSGWPHTHFLTEPLPLEEMLKLYVFDTRTEGARGFYKDRLLRFIRVGNGEAKFLMVRGFPLIWKDITNQEFVSYYFRGIKEIAVN